MHRTSRLVVALVVGVAAPGCTYHPPGERDERSRAAVVGQAFRPAPDCRGTEPLPVPAAPDDLVRYALLHSPTVEAAYWEWRAAIARIPQAGTPETTLAVFGSYGLKGEGSAWDRTTLGLQNDPMFNLPPPSRIQARALAALEEARAARFRFEQVKWDLRRKVLEAYFDYVLLAETIRVADLDLGQWELTVASVEARVEAGTVGQHGLLAARTALDLSRNEAATSRAQLSARVAALNALLGRSGNAPLSMPEAIPEATPLVMSDEAVLELAARANPSLAALESEWRARLAAVREARTGSLPEFSLSGSITGDVMRTVGGMVTVPFLRREAIRGAIEEARAEVRVSEARRREAANDLAASIIHNLVTVRDADRRIELFHGVVVPRAEQAVELARTGYSVDRSTYLEIRDAQRTLLEARQTLSEIRIERARTVADLEALLGTTLAVPKAPSATVMPWGTSPQQAPSTPPAPRAPER